MTTESASKTPGREKFSSAEMLEQEKREKTEKAMDLVQSELRKCFPTDCKRRKIGENGEVSLETIPQEDIIQKFLSVYSDQVRHFLPEERFESVRGRIFSFVGREFRELLGVDDDIEFKRESFRVKKHLKEMGMDENWPGKMEILLKEELRSGNSVKDQKQLEVSQVPGTSPKKTNLESQSGLREVVVDWKKAKEDFDAETEQLRTRDKLAERFGRVKNFDELLLILNDPEFPGIQGSKEFYDGDDLKRILDRARKTGVTDALTRTHGLRDTVERLLKQERSESEGKIGQLKEDKIVEGFGVVDGAVPEIPVIEDGLNASPASGGSAENRDRKRIPETEGKEGEKSSDENPESLASLQSEADRLKKEADEAQRLLSDYRDRMGSIWERLKQYFPSLRKKEEPPSIVDEQKVLERDWHFKLKLYENAQAKLAKREASDKLKREKVSEVAAEAIRDKAHEATKNSGEADPSSNPPEPSKPEEPKPSEGEKKNIGEAADTVIDQILSSSSLAEDRKSAIRRIRERYASFSESIHLKDDSFNETMKSIKEVFFGSEEVPESVLNQKFSVVKMKDSSVGIGMEKAYIAFQRIFMKSGDRLPREVVDRSVGEVIRLFTERFLTGKIPAEMSPKLSVESSGSGEASH